MDHLKIHLIILSLMFGFTSCTPLATEKSPVLGGEVTKQSLTITSVPSPVPTSESTLIPSISLSSIPELSRLSPATYLIYAKAEGPSVKIYAVQPGETRETFLLPATGYFDVSSNGRFIAYTNTETNTLDILNVESSYLQKVPLPVDRQCVDISVSADGTMVACGGNEIRVTADGQKDWGQLTNWSTKKPEDRWDLPRYSPDGKRLAYFNLADIPFGKEDGIYLTDLACLNQIENCKEYTIGPIFNEIAGIPGNGTFFSWSPDSRKMVLSGYDKLYLLDVETGVADELFVDIHPNSVSWSPTGDVIAYSEYDIHLVSLADKKQTQIVNGGRVLGWIVISWRFKKGDKFSVTPKGSNLNIRETPSLGGKVLEVSQNGDTLIILDGPAQSDGYSWWKVKTKQGADGWVVDIPDWYEPAK